MGSNRYSDMPLKVAFAFVSDMVIVGDQAMKIAL
jgi:hypothetical protein